MGEGLGVPDMVAVAAAGLLSGQAEDAEALAHALGSREALAGLWLLRSALASAVGEEAARLLGLPAMPQVPLAAWRADVPRAAAVAVFSQDAAVRAAGRLLALDPQEAGLGTPLPKEAALRLGAAAARPGLAGHYRRSAADALARHALELAASLPGAARLPHGTVAWAGSFDPGEAGHALAWLSQPGPGPYAAALFAVVPEAAP